MQFCILCAFFTFMLIKKAYGSMWDGRIVCSARGEQIQSNYFQGQPQGALIKGTGATAGGSNKGNRGNHSGL
jgi:hypothetical protein